MSHLRIHSFTGNTDHDFTGLAPNQLLRLNNSGTAIESYGTASTVSFSAVTNLDYIDFNTATTSTVQTGRLIWNDADEIGGLEVGMKGGNVTLQIGEENLARIYNDDSVPLTVGMIVYVYSNQGNTISVRRASNTGETTSARVLGMVTEPIAVGARGYISTFGLVRDLDTSAYSGGTPLYVGSASGSFTSVKPVAPNHTCLVGFVSRVHATTGSIFIHISNGWELEELHDVFAPHSALTQSDLLYWDTGNTRWQATGTSALGIVTTTGGTQNYVPKFTAGGINLINSQIFDNGTGVGIGIATPSGKLDIKGSRADSSGTALYIQNSATTAIAQYFDNGVIYFEGGKFAYGPGGAVDLSGNFSHLYLRKADSTKTLGLETAGNNVVFDSNDLFFRDITATATQMFKESATGNFAIGYNHTSPVARLDVKGSRADSSGTGLYIQNSAGTNSFLVRDDGAVSSKLGYWLDNGGTPEKTIFRNGYYSYGFGAGSLLTNTGNGNLAFGYSVMAGLAGTLSGNGNIGIGGGNMGYLTTGSGNIAIGNGTFSGMYLTGDNNIGIGNNAINDNGGVNNSIALGANAKIMGSNQFVIGSASSPINDLYLGRGVYDITGGLTQGSVTIHATGVQGGGAYVDVSTSAATLIFAGSQGTGSGTGGDILFKTAPAGVTGNAQNALVEVLRITQDSKVGIGTATPSEKLHISNGTIRINDTGSTYGAGKLAVSDVNGSISFSSTTALGLGSGTVGGTGTAGKIAKWATSSTLTDSLISETGTGVTVNGSIQIYGNVDVLGTATTFNTQTVQTADNNITMNLSGSHVSAIYGGITVLSGKTNNTSSTWTIDSNGGWSANSYGIFTGLRSDSAGNTLLTYNSAGTNTFLVRDDGNVGVGTTSPTGKLEVLTDNSNYYPLKLNSTNSTLSRLIHLNQGNVQTDFQVATNNGSNSLYLGVGTTTSYLDNRTGYNFEFQKNGSAHSVIDTNNNWGIGTVTPIVKLHIEGGDALFLQSGKGFRINDVGISSYSFWPLQASNEISTNFAGTSKHLLLQTTYGGNIGVGTVSPLDKLHISGGTIRINTVNGTEGAGKLAVSDANGSISFSSTTALGISTTGSTVTKYTTTTTLSNTGTTITHNLNTNYIICAFWDASGNPVIPQYQRINANSIGVSAATTGTYDVVIHG